MTDLALYIYWCYYVSTIAVNLTALVGVIVVMRKLK